MLKGVSTKHDEPTNGFLEILPYHTGCNKAQTQHRTAAPSGTNTKQTKLSLLLLSQQVPITLSFRN